jgi:hypothetical protein
MIIEEYTYAEREEDIRIIDHDCSPERGTMLTVQVIVDDSLAAEERHTILSSRKSPGKRTPRQGRIR